MTQRLLNKIALITGASRGIGAAIAEHYVREGAHVLLLARSVKDLETLDDRLQALGGKTTLIPCDLKDHQKIDALAASILERFGKLDILVGNAGILGDLAPTGHYSPETWQSIIDINLTANWRLIRALDPLLRRAAAGRGIFVTTDTTEPTAYWGPYTASKAGLEALIKTYAAELNTTRVRVNLVNPGGVATRMYAQAFPGADLKTLTQPHMITDKFVELALDSCTLQGQCVHAQ